MKKYLLALAPFFATSTLLGQDVQATATKQQSLMQTLIMIGIALVFFYFILWRPEKKRRQKMESQRSALQKGDKVTAMGIVGTVNTIKDKTVILKMVDGAKIEVVKAAITEVSPNVDEESSSEPVTDS